MSADVRQLVIASTQRELYVLHADRSLARYDTSNKTSPKLLETIDLAPQGQRVTALAMLSGGFSLIVGTDKVELAQWFLVRTKGATFALKRIRGFARMPAEVTALASEFFRKGFVVGDAQGNLGSYFATSERLLFVETPSDQPLVALGVPPRGNGYLAQDKAGKVYSAAVDNPTRRFRSPVSGKRSGTRVTNIPTTCGSRRQPTPTSSPSSASRR